MTPQQIELIKTSFAKVAPISETAAELFYGRLFILDPGLKPLFKGDMKEQGRKLMAMLATAVANLNNLGSIVPAVEALGRRHNDYGAKPKDYQTVAEALLWTLEQGLGDGFTGEVRQAWTECYVTLANVMQEAAAKKTTA
ncbi:globin family protein [Ferrovibrio terrae]|uniref:globin family protein n=1 Tax=Ferrovibrio terrae TaxID=2594003 RepID=UPI003137DC1F